MDNVDVNAITESIIGAAHKVSNTLGAGFVEKVYDRIVVGDFFCGYAKR